MANATAFDWICGELERLTALDTLEARGTVRLALRRAGLEPRSASSQQLSVLARHILGGELRARGIEDADAVCEKLATGLKLHAPLSSVGESPEEVFRRLGGSSRT
jgi:hypothetical protein